MFYQTEHFSVSGTKSVSVKLNKNYSYCKGIAFLAPNGYDANTLISVQYNENQILNPLPLMFLSGDNVDNFESRFFNIFAKITDESEYTINIIQDKLSSAEFKIIFLLTNEVPEYKNVTYDFCKLNLTGGINTGELRFKQNKTIEKFLFMGTSGYDINFIRSANITFLSGLSNSDFGNFKKVNVNKRLFNLHMPSDNLNFSIVGKGIFYAVCKYKDDND